MLGAPGPPSALTDVVVGHDDGSGVPAAARPSSSDATAARAWLARVILASKARRDRGSEWLRLKGADLATSQVVRHPKTAIKEQQPLSRDGTV